MSWSEWLSIIAAITTLIVAILSYVFSSLWIAIVLVVIFIAYLLGNIILLYINLKKNREEQDVLIESLCKKESDKPFKPIAFFSTYETNNGTKGVYEYHKVVQSKRVNNEYYDWYFKWSGKLQPNISSDQQIVSHDIQKGICESDYDCVRINFKHPLDYDEVAVLHLRCEVDDVDRTAKPILEQKVIQPIQFISFRVILKNKSKSYAKLAQIRRCRIDTKLHVDYETISSIPFDKESKSYSYVLREPEIGYFYRLEWEK